MVVEVHMAAHAKVHGLVQSRLELPFTAGTLHSREGQLALCLCLVSYLKDLIETLACSVSLGPRPLMRLMVRRRRAVAIWAASSLMLAHGATVFSPSLFCGCASATWLRKAATCPRVPCPSQHSNKRLNSVYYICRVGHFDDRNGSIRQIPDHLTISVMP